MASSEGWVLFTRRLFEPHIFGLHKASEKLGKIHLCVHIDGEFEDIVGDEWCWVLLTTTTLVEDGKGSYKHSPCLLLAMLSKGETKEATKKLLFCLFFLSILASGGKWCVIANTVVFDSARGFMAGWKDHVRSMTTSLAMACRPHVSHHWKADWIPALKDDWCEILNTEGERSVNHTRHTIGKTSQFNNDIVRRYQQYENLIISKTQAGYNEYALIFAAELLAQGLFRFFCLIAFYLVDPYNTLFDGVAAEQGGYALVPNNNIAESTNYLWQRAGGLKKRTVAEATLVNAAICFAYFGQHHRHDINRVNDITAVMGKMSAWDGALTYLSHCAHSMSDGDGECLMYAAQGNVDVRKLEAPQAEPHFFLPRAAIGPSLKGALVKEMRRKVAIYKSRLTEAKKQQQWLVDVEVGAGVHVDTEPGQPMDLTEDNTPGTAVIFTV
jgi:hypothetical protein